MTAKHGTTLPLHAAAHISSILGQILSGVVLAHALSPAGMGQLNLIQGFCLMATPLLELGTKGNLYREIAGANPEKWIKAANTLSIITGSVALIGLLATRQPAITNLCFLLACYTLAIEHRATSIGLLKTNLTGKLKRDIVANTLGSAFRIAGALLANNPNTIIVLVFGSYIVEATIRRISNETLTKKLPGTEPETLKALTKESLWILPSQFAGQLTANANRFWIEASHGLAILGTFGVAQRQGIAFTLANQLLYERHFAKPSLKIACAFAASAALVTLLSCPLIPFLYGKGFHDAITWSIWLLIPNILGTLGATSNLKLVRNRQIKTSTLTLLTGTGVTLGLNALLISPFGIPGTAMALAGGSALQLLLQTNLHRPCPQQKP